MGLICTNISVGLLSMVHKVCVILLVAFASKCARLSFEILVSFRLRKKGRAPVMYDTDTSMQSFRVTLGRFGSIRYVGFFALAVLSFALLPAEIVSEFGVNASDRCGVKYTKSFGVCAKPSQHDVTWSKRIPTAFFVEDVAWNNKHLSTYPIQQGLRMQINGDEYFGPSNERNRSLPIVVANCSVGPLQMLDHHRFVMELGKDNSTHIEGLRLLRIHARDGSMFFRGYGGLLDNYESFFSFLVSGASSPNSLSANVIEYTDPRKFREIRLSSEDSSLLLPKSAILSYNVSCGIASLTLRQFTKAIYSYRYAQMVRSYHRNHVPVMKIKSVEHPVPRPLAVHDVVRAVLAAKLTEKKRCEGESMFYTQCSCYSLVVAMPLLVITASLVLVYVYLYVRADNTKDLVKAPVASSEWGLFALSNCKGRKFLDTDSEQYDALFAEYGYRPCIGQYQLIGDGKYEINQLFFVGETVDDKGGLRRFLTNQSSSAISIL